MSLDFNELIGGIITLGLAALIALAWLIWDTIRLAYRRPRHWSDNEISPPDWVNQGARRPHHGRCRRNAWTEGCDQ